jgi:hypothetical protein
MYCDEVQWKQAQENGVQITKVLLKEIIWIV